MQETAEKLAHFFSELGVDFIYDIVLARHICLIESAKEFVRHHQDKNKKALLSSTCPGFVCYAEKSQGEILVPLLSQIKSPQQIMGILVKQRLPSLIRSNCGDQYKDATGKRIYHITLMPCYDKKLEASRLDNRIQLDQSGDSVAEVDCVITPLEVEKLLEVKQISDLASLPSKKLDQIYAEFNQHDGIPELHSHLGSGAGGYAENIFRYVAMELYGERLKSPLHSSTSLEWKINRNVDYQELALYDNGSLSSDGSSGKPILSFAIMNGFRSIQNLVTKLKRNACNHDYIEVSACPKGCLNGGGQLRPVPDSAKTSPVKPSQFSRDPNQVLFEQVSQVYTSLPVTKYPIDLDENRHVEQLGRLSLHDVNKYEHSNERLYSFLNIDQELRESMHTKFKALEKSFNIITTKW